MSDAEKAAAGPEDSSVNGSAVEPSGLLVPGTNERGLADKGERRATFSTPADNASVSEKPPTSSAGASTTAVNTSTPNVGSVKRRRRATTRGSRHRNQLEEVLSMEQRDGLCGLIQGHLVVFPYDWLIGAEQRGDWLTLVDQAAPLQI
jgi:phospholipase D1/2